MNIQLYKLLRNFKSKTLITILLENDNNTNMIVKGSVKEILKSKQFHEHERDRILKIQEVGDVIVLIISLDM